MGRAKVRMELIKSEKARHAALKSRKSGLKKKIQELSTLCDVKVCMIMYEPRKDGRPVEPEIWPTDPNEIQELFNRYVDQPDDDRSKRTADLLSFFKDRNEKLETTLMKQRKKNTEAKYPTWDARYDDLSEEQLREFARILDTKIQAAKPRLELLENYQMLESSSGPKVYSNCYASEYSLRSSTSSNEFDMGYRPQPHEPLSEVKSLDKNDQTGEDGAMNANYTMTTLMNSINYAQLSQHEEYLHNSSFMYMPMPLNGPMYADNMPGLLDYMMAANNPSAAGPDCNYGLTMQQLPPLPQQYGQCPTKREDGYYKGLFKS